MLSTTISRCIVLVSTLLLCAGLLSSDAQDSHRRGRKYKAPTPVSRIEVTVLRADDGKPLENAAVIFHTLKDPGNMELKSNEDGKAMIDVLPIGDVVRLQIIAKGYQTFGQDYPINKDQMAIEVHMKRPGKQYSIYDNQAGDQKDQGKKDQGQPKQEQPKQDQPKEDSKPSDQPQN